ncbi:hypothetical protein A2155_02515 [candidate division WWE3 bacterium RBG_16_52_45]|nr:MAG: hypothetical protein A2155_02515 [candidate division WWE3 bacterium RBG_16_52_45]
MNFGIYSHIALTLLFTGPAILLFWIFGFTILKHFFKLLLVCSLLIGVFYGLIVDSFAIPLGLWSFDPVKILGIGLGYIPVDQMVWSFFVTFTMGSFIVLGVYLEEKYFGSGR